MTTQRIATTREALEQQRRALLGQLRRLGNLMRGTVVERGVRCGRATCECARGEQHRKVYLSVNVRGRTQGAYLGHGRMAAVAPLLAEYQRAWRLINELTEVNLELLRGDHPGGRPRGRRR